MRQADKIRCWRVVQRGTDLVLARFSSKPKAVSAALRFSADGHAYDVVEESAVIRQEARILPLRPPQRGGV